ncbi:MAG: ATP-sensitive inward rectifier potassium channel 10 [Alphaproteobacteria bacterium]|nr:ATP-sensitive inward rectifier potassium channel 10 [Alphaproteobacteria bacterium]
MADPTESYPAVDRRRHKRVVKTIAPNGTHRFISRDGRVNVHQHGIKHHSPRDWYHWSLTLKWPRLVFFVFCIFLFVNALFAFLYWLDSSPNAVVGARARYYPDLFFFSVQTFATVGYGVMYPGNLYASILSTLESFVGLAYLGLFTGLLFNRFSRPSARVMFSHYAVVAPYEGAPTLMFRAANRRGNQILNAEIHVSLTRNEKTLEGESVRRVYDLKLLRASSSFFNLTWTVRHAIDKDSPLYGETSESLQESETEIVVLLSGVDDVYGQVVHGRFAFNYEEILFGYHFVSMFTRNEKNIPVVDFTKFDAVEPVEGQDSLRPVYSVQPN